MPSNEKHVTAPNTAETDGFVLDWHSALTVSKGPNLPRRPGLRGSASATSATGLLLSKTTSKS
jgi:hypothetical protein